MEVGETGKGGGGGLAFFFFYGAITNACVLLAELYIAYTASIYNDTLGVLQNLP